MRETGGMNPSPASSQKVCGKFVGGGVPTPRGEMTKKVYKLGDKVCVRVADADKMLKTVDFELVADIWNDEEEN